VLRGQTQPPYGDGRFQGQSSRLLPQNRRRTAPRTSSAFTAFLQILRSRSAFKLFDHRLLQRPKYDDNRAATVSKVRAELRARDTTVRVLFLQHLYPLFL
jgi:hypothetical protein